MLSPTRGALLCWVVLGLVRAQDLPDCTFDSCTQCFNETNSFTASQRGTYRVWGVSFVQQYNLPLRIPRPTIPGKTAMALSGQILGIVVSELLNRRVQYVDCQNEVQCTFAMAHCAGWMDGVCDHVVSYLGRLPAAIASGRKRFSDGAADVMVNLQSSSAYFNEANWVGAAPATPFNQQTGSIGYTKITGVYLFKDTLDAGTASSGRELEWWDSFRHPEARAALQSPQDFIDAGVEGDEGCNSSVAAVETNMQRLRDMGWSCVGSWFLNTACAAMGGSWSTNCLAVLDVDWQEEETDLYASLVTSVVPVAKVTLGYQKWTELVTNTSVKAAFIWSEPDALLLHRNPVRLALRSSETPAARVFSKVAYEFLLTDERFLTLMGAFGISNAQILELMQRASQRIAATGDHPSVDMQDKFYQKLACDWVREHETTIRQVWLTTVNVCGPGQYVDETTAECTRCDRGTELQVDPNAPTGLSCVTCAAGRYSSQGRECEHCRAGDFGNQTGQSRCNKCEPGQYTPESGQSVCLNCPAGTISTRQGRTECVECNAGAFSVEGGTECQGCGLATFAEEIGSGECTPCREGLTTRRFGSTSLSDCTCPEDSYWPFGEVLDNSTGSPFVCTPCPTDHFTCREGSKAEDFANGDVSRMSLLEGYMSKVDDPFQIYKCLPPEACPGGPPGVCAPNRDPKSTSCGRGLPDTYETDEGFEVCNSSGADWALVVLFCILGLVGLCLFSFAISRDVHNQTNAGLLVMAVCGISFSGFQTMGVFNNLSIVWFEPLRSIFRVVSLVSLDIKYLRITCLFTSVGPTTSYIMRQLIAPAGVVVMFATLFVKKFFVPVDVLPEFVNAVGSVFTLFFTSIVISAATPFICYAHPVGDKSSMVSEPSVLCFEDDEHAVMVSVGLVSFCLVALPFLALSAYGTLRHHTLLSSHLHSHGRQLRAFRFLFIRFRHEIYYYSLIMSMRSVCVCLVPTMPGIRNDPAMQFSCLSAVLGTFIVAQLALWPWRSTLANMADGVLMSCNLQLLVCAAIHTDFTDTESIGLFGSIVFSLFCVLIIAGCVIALRMYFVPNPWYHYFICHHKGGAAAQARYLKVLLQERASCNVFIDSDDLRELDKLFDTVKTKVGMLVVYLTRETLMRPWCAGEVYTAFRSRVKVQVLEHPSFVPPTEAELEDMENYLDVRSCNLTQYGIDLADVADAFRKLMDASTPKIIVPRGGTNRWKTICDELTNKMRKSSVKDTLHANSFVVSSELHHEEASAAAGIISSKIKIKIMQMSESTHLCVTCDHPDASLGDIARVVAQAKSVVVLLSSGTLFNIQQVMVIVGLMSQGGADVIPVRIAGFDFPDDDYFTRDLAALWPGDSREAAVYMRSFFKRIAIHLEIAGSEQILQKQIDDIFARVSATKRKSGASTAISAEVKALLEAQHELPVNELLPTGEVDLKEDDMGGDMDGDKEDYEAITSPQTVVVKGTAARVEL